MFQAGNRLGRRHLRILLTAVGRGCLQGTNNTKEKVSDNVRGDVSCVSCVPPSARAVNLRHVPYALRSITGASVGDGHDR